LRVRFQYFGPAAADGRRHRAERPILLIRRGKRQYAGRGLGLLPDLPHGRGDLVRSFNSLQRRSHGRVLMLDPIIS
jgi:hypothetical protein